jgi:hypothetical protein
MVCRFTTTIEPCLCGNTVKIDEYLLFCTGKADVDISYFDFEPRFSGFGTEKTGEIRVYTIDFILCGEKETEFVIEKKI